ncbi:Adenylate cyclase [hydrothermal vent metagenome]|uniref:Adenylate cyclase n=1 Tax=hydrothermal vent metagenome TaxID=652676 RepID=A0A1W1C5W1_9ZZZZ
MKQIGQKEEAVPVLRAILKELLSDIYAYRERVLKEADNEVLHQFRISVRRSVVLMGEFSFLDGSGRLPKHRKALKTLIGISNTKRDLDVLYGRVCSLNSGPKESVEARLLLKERLEKMLQKEHRMIMEYLLSETCNGILYSWESYLSEKYVNTASEEGSTTLKKLSDRVIYGRFLKIKKQIKLLDRKRDSIEKKLHTLRISYKKLRYLLETFTFLYQKKKMQKCLKEMKKIQNVLGAYHDSYQQVILLAKLQQNEKDETLRSYIERILEPDLKRYQKKEIEKIKKQLKKFRRKEKRYKKLFNRNTGMFQK